MVGKPQERIIPGTETPAMEAETSEEKQPFFKDYRIVGQVFRTYWIVLSNISVKNPTPSGSRRSIGTARSANVPLKSSISKPKLSKSPRFSRRVSVSGRADCLRENGIFH